MSNLDEKVQEAIEKWADNPDFEVYADFSPLVKSILGLILEAKAEALEEIDTYIDEVLFRQDETGPLVGGRGPLMHLFRQKAEAYRASYKP